MAHSEWRSTCCNPFNIGDHGAKRKNLRSVSQWMCEKNPKIAMGSKICDNCRKKLLISIPDPYSESGFDKSPTPSPPGSPPGAEVHKFEELESMKLINQCLEVIGETPISKRKQQSKKYLGQKLDQLITTMEKAMIGEASTTTEDGSEIIEQLKEKFHSTSERSIKVQVLTVLPKRWSVRKIQTEFDTSNFMARRAKQLVKEKGVLSSPNPKPGHCIAKKKTTELVVGFYESDNSSRMMPGKKDFVSVKQAHGRIQIQKRLVLCNLKELYQQFKAEYPFEGIGFSKFADLRPKHCVLAGARGTHSVCVCTIHQNVKLMLLGAKLDELPTTDDTPLNSYHHCLARLICNPPLPECYSMDLLCMQVYTI